MKRKNHKIVGTGIIANEEFLMYTYDMWVKGKISIYEVLEILDIEVIGSY